MKPVAELIAVPGKSFPALVFADGFRDLPAGTKLYAGKDVAFELLRELAALKRYDNKSGWTGKKVGVVSTLSIPDDLLERIDIALGERPWAT